MDDATVDRVIAGHAEQRDDMWLYDEQLRRWSKEALNVDQQREIARLQTALGEVKSRIADILALAAELREGTIDRIMEKSNLELGLEAMLGGPRSTDRL
jgi:predicted RNA-binding Zn ribbon-like protein